MPEPQESEPVILLDLDGTLADFDGAMSKAMNQLRSPGEPPWNMSNQDESSEPPYLTARRRLVKSRPGFWRDLPRLEDGFLVMETAQRLGYRPMVLSRGPRKQAAAWAEKLEWCRKHLGDTPVTLTEDKGLVYGKVLVDDWPPYVTRWLEWRKRGLVIMPTREWNVDFRHPQVLRFVKGENDYEMLEALKDRLFPNI